jgi:hypothetical protein
MKNGLFRGLAVCWVACISRSSRLFVVFAFAVWIFLSDPVLASISYTPVSDILGTPTEFIAEFRRNFQGKLNEYIGLLVSFYGASIVIKSLIKS